MKVNVSPEKLLETGAHFGHQTRRWNPKMRQYIYGDEEKIHIFDLIKTKACLEEALSVLEKAAKEKKEIVFVGTKKQVKLIIARVAKDAECPFVNERWLGGIITNFGQIKKSIEKLHQLREDKKEGRFKVYTKKERILLDREIERLERFFGGIENLKGTPDLLVIVDLKKEKGAAVEARKKKVPSIGVVDTNSDPDLVDYVIPMNDDATKALEYVLGLMGEVICKAKKKK